MADTIRERIIKEITTSLEVIMKTSGYNSDIGLKVFRALKKIDFKKDPPCAVVTAGQEAIIRREFAKVFCTMPIEIEAIEAVGALSEAAETAEALLGDMVKVVTKKKMSALASSVTYTRGGAAGYPDPGERVVACQVTLTVEYSFLAGDPYSQ